MSAIKEKENGYEEFVKLVKEEYPNPLYFFEEEGEYVQRFIKENPGTIIHRYGIKGKAVCMDSQSSLKYAYDNAKAITDFVYATSILKLGMMSTTVDTVWKVKGGD